MKILIKETIKAEREVDVSFPIYRKQMLDGSTIYMKVESQKTQISIHVYDCHEKIEIEIDAPSFYGSINYLLGIGEYASSEKEYLKAMGILAKLTSRL